MKTKTSSPAPYICITKVGYNPETKQAVCVRFHVNDLLAYVKYLDAHFPAWTWTNVFAAKGHRAAPERTRLGNFTKFQRPAAARPF